MTATNPTSSLGMQNWYSDTLAQACGASDTTIYLNNVPSPSEGYLVIDPSNVSTREVIHYTSKGAGSVTLPGTGDRGLDGTTAQSHAQGTAVELHNTTSYFTALQNGWAMTAGAITATLVANASLPDSKLLSGKIVGRVGGDATVWGTAGSTGFSTSTVNTLIQVGEVTTSSGNAVTVTFQTAFSQNPIIIGSQQGLVTTRAWFSVDSSSASSFTCSLITSANARYAGSAGWIAIGPA